VIHDAYCDPPYRETWQKVHRMFYYALLAEGTPQKKALAMYTAVYHYGPQWAEPEGWLRRIGGSMRNMIDIITPGPDYVPPPAPPPPPGYTPPPPPSPEEEAALDRKKFNEIESLIDAMSLTTPEEVECLILQTEPRGAIFHGDKQLRPCDLD
jgi:hypothetical protein